MSLCGNPVSRLETPFSIESVMKSCADFTIKSMDENIIEREEEMDITQVYAYDKLEPYCLTENLEPASDDEETASDDISRSFPVFRKKMTKVTDDGKVLKLLEKEGCGSRIPEDAVMIAYLHYAAYVEFAEYPFDVTRLRHKKPLRIKLGVSEVVPGFEIAIKSMRKSEKSKFLVHPDLAYKNKGVPPRIPPDATILYDVELFDLCENTSKYDSDDEEKMPPTFKEILKKAKDMRNRGNKLKQLEKNLNGAISMYRKCLYYLIQAHYNNDEDEITAKEEIVKVYSNLAVCYMQKENYKKVCTMYNDAKHDCQSLAENNVKLLYNSAKALRFLGSFEEATRRLRKANRIKPGDDSVVQEMTKLEECKKNHQENERLACKKMFGFYGLVDSDEREEIEYQRMVKVVSNEFKASFSEIIADFSQKEERSLRIDINALTTDAEKSFLKKECAKKRLIIQFKNDCMIIKKQELY